MTWTDERVETLKKLWTDGLSASQIAAELGGITRNAVIGKVHRLGLSGRAKSPSSAAPRPRKPRPHSHMLRVSRPVDPGQHRARPCLRARCRAGTRAGRQRHSARPAPHAARAHRGHLPLADRRSRPAPISSSAAARPSPACPTAPITRASPISRPTCAATGGRSGGSCYVDLPNAVGWVKLFARLNIRSTDSKALGLASARRSLEHTTTELATPSCRSGRRARSRRRGRCGSGRSRGRG